MSNAPPDPSTDKAWAIQMMARFQQGDVEAFNLLHETFNPQLLRFLAARLSRIQDAWDVSQNTWLRIFRHSHRNFNPDGHFVGWLFSQARSELSGWLRRNGESLVDLDDVSEAEVTARDDRDAHRVLEDIETKEQLWAALSELRPDHREIIILRFFEDLDLKACAEVLNVAVGTVGSRQHAAIHALRKVVQRSPRSAEL